MKRVPANGSQGFGRSAGACFLSLAWVAVVLLGSVGCGRRTPAQPLAGDRVRVVSLAPSLTEIICAVGGGTNLVGRTSVCNYPPEITRRIPVVGGFGVPSLEQLAVVAPTFTVDVALSDETLGRQIDGMGIRREHVACNRLDDIPAAIRKIGVLLGREAAAEPMASGLERDIVRLRADADRISRRPSVYIEIWHDPAMTVGSSSFVSELVELAGGRNIGAVKDKEYYTVSPEWVVAQDPEIILCFYMAEQGSALERVRSRPGWDALTAVRTGAVYDGFDNDIMLRPGVRVLEGVNALRARIQKEGAR